jgi:F-type H+-transporting ATPase subunit b
VELNWSTFILEIINFLLLVWILKHFFYAPVMKVIEQRRQAIDASLAQAAAKRAEAEAMEEKYQSRLEDWEREKQRARESMHQEVSGERDRLLAALRKTLENERTKAQVLEQRRLEEERRMNEQEALANAAEFAGRLLTRLTGPELEQRLCQLLLAQLPALPGERRDALRAGFRDDAMPVRVASAYPLAPEMRTALQNALGEVAAQRIECAFMESPELIAGLRINIGPLVLRANIRDELRFFIEAGHVPD